MLSLKFGRVSLHFFLKYTQKIAHVADWNVRSLPLKNSFFCYDHTLSYFDWIGLNWKKCGLLFSTETFVFIFERPSQLTTTLKIHACNFGIYSFARIKSRQNNLVWNFIHMTYDLDPQFNFSLIIDLLFRHDVTIISLDLGSPFHTIKHYNDWNHSNAKVKVKYSNTLVIIVCICGALWVQII